MQNVAPTSDATLVTELAFEAKSGSDAKILQGDLEPVLVGAGSSDGVIQD